MAKTKLTVAEFLAKFERSGLDPLGLEQNAEMLMHLANASWKRAIQDVDAAALVAWLDTVRDIYELEPTDENIRHWLDEELLKVKLIHEKYEELGDSLGAPKRSWLKHVAALNRTAVAGAAQLRASTNMALSKFRTTKVKKAQVAQPV